MNKNHILSEANGLVEKVTYANYLGVCAEFKALVGKNFGRNCPYYEAITKIDYNNVLFLDQIESVIRSFIKSVEKDLI